MDLISLDMAVSAAGDALPYFELQTPLDGITYTLEFRWNVRNASWYMNLWDESGQTLYLAGVRLVAEAPLGAHITGRQPAGCLVIHDTSGAGADPGLADLGVRHALYYITAAELAALLVA